MSGADEVPWRFDRPLRIAALVKQIPVGESMQLGNDRRLVREGLELEMNAYCRRAVSKGVEWARASGGTCTVFTLGLPRPTMCSGRPLHGGPTRECTSAIGRSEGPTRWPRQGAGRGAAREGPFDLVLVGRNSLDGDTGQVGPEVAQLADLPFARARIMAIDGERMSLTLQDDDGWEEVEIDLPAVLSVAERLCEPCKVPPTSGPKSRRSIRVVTAAELGPGPWGQAGSPTRVGPRVMRHDRSARY